MTTAVVLRRVSKDVFILGVYRNVSKSVELPPPPSNYYHLLFYVSLLIYIDMEKCFRSEFGRLLSLSRSIELLRVDTATLVARFYIFLFTIFILFFSSHILAIICIPFFVKKNLHTFKCQKYYFI